MSGPDTNETMVPRRLGRSEDCSAKYRKRATYTRGETKRTGTKARSTSCAWDRMMTRREEGKGSNTSGAAKRRGNNRKCVRLRAHNLKSEYNPTGLCETQDNTMRI